MQKLDKAFIDKAFYHQAVSDLYNDVLYKLCKDHPDHIKDDVIVAKTLIIGRVYAAALERRRIKSEASDDASTPSDSFYIKVADKFKKSQIDLWLRDLSKLNNEIDDHQEIAISVHKKLVDLLKNITGMEKRSFASKYLHFHFKDYFYIYDSISDKSVREISKREGIKLNRNRNRMGQNQNADAVYTDHYARCQKLNECMKGKYGRLLTPRELDKVLLYWGNPG